jgi:hypothetical protein
MNCRMNRLPRGREFRFGHATTVVKFILICYTKPSKVRWKKGQGFDSTLYKCWTDDLSQLVS